MNARGAGRPRKWPSSSDNPSASTSGAKSCFQRFKSTYTNDFPCILPSSVSKTYARCMVCESDFSVAHGGYDDVVRHTKSVKHIRAGSALKGTTQLTSYFASAKKDDSDNAIIRAETLFCLFLVEHNIPISAADHASQLFKTMLP